MSASPYPLFEARAVPSAFLLAALLSAYPGETFEASARALVEDPDLVRAEALLGRDTWSAVEQALAALLSRTDGIDDLRSEYIDTFDRGQGANPLYETEYGRERAILKANELADLAGFYRAFGLEVDEDTAHELHDHLSVELEFYALMRLKYAALEEAGDEEGCDIVQDGCRKFLEAHLGRFVGAIESRPGVVASPFYGPVIRWCRALVERECARLEVSPEPVVWLASQAEPPSVECGAALARLQ